MITKQTCRSGFRSLLSANAFVMRHLSSHVSSSLSCANEKRRKRSSWPTSTYISYVIRLVGWLKHCNLSLSFRLVGCATDVKLLSPLFHTYVADLHTFYWLVLTSGGMNTLCWRGWTHLQHVRKKPATTYLLCDVNTHDHTGAISVLTICTASILMITQALLVCWQFAQRQQNECHMTVKAFVLKHRFCKLLTAINWRVWLQEYLPYHSAEPWSLTCE